MGVAGSLLVYQFGTEWRYRELLVVVPAFFAGTAIWAWNRQYVTPAGPITRTSTIGCSAAIPVACYLPAEWIPAVVLLAVFGLLGALARCGPSAPSVWLIRPLVYLGEVSYSLYMTHTLAQKLLYRLLPSGRFVEESVPWKAGVLGVYALTVVVFCLTCYYLVERPSRDRFRRRLSRHSAAL